MDYNPPRPHRCSSHTADHIPPSPYCHQNECDSDQSDLILAAATAAISCATIFGSIARNLSCGAVAWSRNVIAIATARGLKVNVVWIVVNSVEMGPKHLYSMSKSLDVVIECPKLYMRREDRLCAVAIRFLLRERTHSDD